MPGSFLLLLSVCLFCVIFVFRCRKNQVIIILWPEENMGGKKKTNGYANPIDEEHNRRASIFFPIKAFEDQHVSVRFSRDTLRIGQFYTQFGSRLSRIQFVLKLKPSIQISI